MRTNIALDEALIEKAQELTSIKSKRAVVDEALRMLIQLYEQAEVRQLRGQLRWDEPDR
jgi:Arc/MetJ family transcription regulator